MCVFVSWMLCILKTGELVFYIMKWYIEKKKKLEERTIFKSLRIFIPIQKINIFLSSNLFLYFREVTFILFERKSVYKFFHFVKQNHE